MIKSCICTLTHSSWLRILAHRRSVALAAIFHVQCWAKHTMPNSQLVSQLLGRPWTLPLTTSFKRKNFENEHKTPKLDSAWKSLNSIYLALRVFTISGYTNEFARHVKDLETRICSTARRANTLGGRPLLPRTNHRLFTRTKLVNTIAVINISFARRLAPFPPTPK